MINVADGFGASKIKIKLRGLTNRDGNYKSWDINKEGLTK